jgi:hypothetical protein
MVHRMRALPERLSALNKSIRAYYWSGSATCVCCTRPGMRERSAASSGMPTTRRLQARRLMLRPSRLPSAPWQGRAWSVWCSTPAALRIWVGGSVAAAAGRAKCCVRGQSRARHCQLANTKQTLAANEAVDAGLEAHGFISMGWEHHGNLKIFTPCGPNTELQLG